MAEQRPHSDATQAPAKVPEEKAEDLLLLGLQRLADEGEASFILDINGRLIHANAAMRDLLPRLEAATPQLLERLLEEALATLPAGDDQAAAPSVTGWQSLPAQHLNVLMPNGAERLTASLALCFDDLGRPRLLSGRLLRSGQDLERERAGGDRFETMRARFEDIVRLVSDWVWETDRKLRLTYVSQRVGETLGQHPRELLGRNLLEMGQSPQLAALLTEEWRRPFRDVEVEIPDREGTPRLFRLSGVPVYAPHSGVFSGFRGTAHDVTRERMRERAILQAKEAAESANRAKSEFLAAISHELRTPLNAVIGFSEVMMTEAFGPLGQSVYSEYARDIHASAEHLLELINDILDVSKIEAGKLDLDEEETDVAALIESAARLIRARAEETGIDLTVAVDTALPEVTLDARAFKQVLLNLLSNAVKFTEAGGTVEVAGEIEADGGFCLTVRDSGIGMTGEEIAIALTPFGQVDSSLSRKFEGTGLGLPLTKGLIELHGGRLEIDSRKPGGTTVAVRLPGWRTVVETPAPVRAPSEAAAEA